MRVFRSIHHPGRTPAPLVLARAQARGLALGLLPVMVLATATILQGASPLATLTWTVPLVCVAALAWAAYDVRRRPAAIVLDGGAGAVRSVWDVARRGENGGPLTVVLPSSKVDGVLHAALGDATLPLYPSDWPDFDGLVDALRAASTHVLLDVALAEAPP